MKLPLEFLDIMRKMLGEEEFRLFAESYDSPRYYGLRVNTIKTSVNAFKEISPFKLEPVSWTKDGFYYPAGENPGRHPYYHAGLYYIQEPSAMLPGAVINALPGENILDLCAAPGGKTVQIAAAMQGKGLLVANDISSERVKALVKNVELCGVRNILVTNDTPARLADKFEGWFDRVLVDAPCSGEGMFRKDEEAARSWQKFKCEKCSGMQWDILQSVDRLLKPGGTLVYSTCTFSPEEDEMMIARFLDAFRGYEVMEIPDFPGIGRGRPEWGGGDVRLSKTVRLWPHKIKGEGHFAAVLVKTGGYGLNRAAIPGEYVQVNGKPEEFVQFEREALNTVIEGNFILKGGNLYCLPVNPPNLDGIKVAKFGWYLGEIKNGRFEPSHSLCISLDSKDIKLTADFEANSDEISRYLKGETVMHGGRKGYTAVCVDGYTLGWAKQTGDMLKNLYPKGWRRMS